MFVFHARTLFIYITFQGQQQQQQKLQTANNSNKNNNRLTIIFCFCAFFSASSSSIIIEVIGNAILMHVGKHAGSIPLCASNSIRTITMYYVHVRKIHQSQISETEGTLYYTVSQTH